MFKKYIIFATQKKSMFLSVEHLDKSINKLPILRDISFSIDSSQVVGLLGPNGAGKSTLMKTLIGLWSFDGGKINLNGVESKRIGKKLSMPLEVTRNIGYLPENNPLYDYMYVREYLLYMAQMSGLEKQQRLTRVEELVDMVGLGKMANKRIKELSKGYKQRVGLAQAMLSEAPVLILDEPTTGFDPNQLEDIRTLIRELGKKHIVLLSTHILQEVKAMCSRVIIMADGQIKADLSDISNIDLDQTFRTVTNG